MNGPNHATVFSDQGCGVRAPVVFYNRSNEAAAMLKPGDFDWNAIMKGASQPYRTAHRAPRRALLPAPSHATCHTHHTPSLRRAHADGCPNPRAGPPCNMALAFTVAGGARWFHSGGIYSALSPTTPELIIEGMKAAHANGAVTSFDLNYRAKLWKLWGGHEQAPPPSAAHPPAALAAAHSSHSTVHYDRERDAHLLSPRLPAACLSPLRHRP